MVVATLAMRASTGQTSPAQVDTSLFQTKGLTRSRYDYLSSFPGGDLDGNGIPDSIERQPYNTHSISYRPDARRGTETSREVREFIVTPRNTIPGDSVYIHVRLARTDIPDTLSICDTRHRPIVADLPINRWGRTHGSAWRVAGKPRTHFLVVLRTPSTIRTAKIAIQALKKSDR